MQTRRDFLRQSLTTTAVGCAAPLALSGCSGPTTMMPSDPQEPLFRISLAQWSLHKQLRGEAEPKLDNLEFAAKARELGFEAIEYVNQFFKERARDSSYIAEMRRRAEDAGVRSLLIMVDGEGQLGAPDAAARTKAVDNHVQWLEAAQSLGCHSIRVNAASGGTWDEQRDLAADGLHALCERAVPFGLDVIVENHGGLSSNGRWLASVMRQVDHPRCGTLPDFGNFRINQDESYDRYQGVEELMPFAKAVSAKSHDFDADGNETHTDYRRMMQIVLDAGYSGWVGVEFEGGGLPAVEGILATRRLLERVRGELRAV